MTTWFFRTDSVAQLAVRPSLEATVTVPIPGQWIEACEGFGCGQCHRRNYSEGAVLGDESAAAAARRRRGRGFLRAAGELFLAVGAVALLLCCCRSAQRIHSAGVELGVLDEKRPLMGAAGSGKTA